MPCGEVAGLVTESAQRLICLYLAVRGDVSEGHVLSDWTRQERELLTRRAVGAPPVKIFSSFPHTSGWREYRPTITLLMANARASI
jgi:hypothetical protein